MKLNFVVRKCCEQNIFYVLNFNCALRDIPEPGTLFFCKHNAK